MEMREWKYGDEGVWETDDKVDRKNKFTAAPSSYLLYEDSSSCRCTPMPNRA
jgi:hypothetical protein